MKIIVVGGGASGMITALLASKNHKVLILEENDKVGKKILATGNGKCNYWNKQLLKEDYNLKDYYSDDNSILKEILTYRKETFEYLKELLIFPKEIGNYMYPYSNQASSIREIFYKELLRNNIKIEYNKEIKEIKKRENQFEVIDSNNTIYLCDKVVLACGTLASQKESKLELKKFIPNSIKTYPFLPSLVPLKLDLADVKEWAGIRTQVKLSLFEDKIFIKEEFGEIQLTDYGISGIVTFNISGYVSRMLYHKKRPIVKIDFMPDFETNNKLFSFLEERVKNHLDYTIEELLESIFPYKLMFVILNKASIDKKKYGKEVTKEDIERIVNTIKHFEVEIIGTKGMDRAQVCTGGISLKEMNHHLELKKVKDMYVIGELLNVDGMCGGFNLAFAFITGYIVGKSIGDL